MQPAQMPTYVSAIPALRQIGIGRTRAYEILNDGLIPAKKVGTRTMVRPEDVSAYAEALPSYPVAAGRTKTSTDGIRCERFTDLLAASPLPWTLPLELE